MSRLVVVYAADNNYASLAGISMLSLFENNKECRELVVYILADNIDKDNQQKMLKVGACYGREVHFIDASEALTRLQEKGINGYSNADNKGYTAYARLFISDLLLNEERIIYLDCDTLVLGDIETLNNIDMEGLPIGMAYDCCHNKYKKYILGNEGIGYYNSGVTIFDISVWKEKECMDRILWHIANVREYYPLVDQDMFNVALHDDIYKIDAKYNYLSQYYLYTYRNIKKVYGLNATEFYTEDGFPKSSDAVILHFCGQTFIRPWYRNSKHPAKQMYDKYYKLSPWRDEPQRNCKWSLQYLVQYLLWKYMPESVAAVCGKIMQRLFMRITYKV